MEIPLVQLPDIHTLVAEHVATNLANDTAVFSHLILVKTPGHRTVLDNFILAEIEDYYAGTCRMGKTGL